jgi:hypothetical protein
LQDAGYGYSIFASNVLGQGWVSGLQLLTMAKMKMKIEDYKSRLYGSRDYDENGGSCCIWDRGGIAYANSGLDNY